MVADATDRRENERLDVTTSDGSRIALWVEGHGPPLVLLHGSLADHSVFTSLVQELRADFTTFAMDRRGFGASPDSDGYTIEREFADVAAVVDAIAASHDGPITLLGHSFGANCAMGGAARTPNVRHLVLYEPSLGLPSSVESVEAVERELAAGRREAAVMMVLVDQLEMTPEDVEALRSSARWPNLLEGAHTMPRETRVEMGWQYAPGQFDTIAAPTLMLAGSDSIPPMTAATIAAAAAIPNALIRVLPGHDHFAHRTDPGLVAKIIRHFVDT